MNAGATRGIGEGFCLIALGVLLPSAYALAEPITSIFINYLELPDQPLDYVFDEAAGEGLLTIDIDSFSVLVERLVAGETVAEFIDDASFHLQAQMLTDTSSGGQAAGFFASLQFELLDAGMNTLLAGANLTDADVSYTETGVRDVMLIEGGLIPITGGSLAVDFDVAAALAGIGFLIQPGTGDFEALDTDHSGAINLNLNAIPEPASAVFLAWALVGLCGRRRCCLHRVAACLHRVAAK